MKQIRYLTIRFDTEIKQYEIPAFRGAIAEKAGREHISFHNHLGDSAYVYRYPVIQYKRIGTNPAIVCVDQGVDEIHHFFNNRSWDILLGERPMTLKVKDLRLQQYTLQVWEHTFSFRIKDWLALNQENYLRFQNTPGEAEQLAMLEKILVSNILSLAKGVEWFIEKPVRVQIRFLSTPRLVRFKEQLLTAFDAELETNVFLPDFIGLGKGVSHGFGVMTRRRGRVELGRTERAENERQTTQQDDEY